MNNRDDRQLFRETQRRLAGWYAGVMGAILGLGGLGLYEVVIHAHRMTLDREVQSVTATIHASLEPLLTVPGVVSPEARRLLPNFCDRELCRDDRHDGFPVAGRDYYAILYDRNGTIAATSGRQPDLSKLYRRQTAWLTDNQGERFYQTSIALHTRDGGDWGVLYVGRSIRAWDAYLRVVRWSLVIGLPVGWVIVGWASWWLAGLAMLPVRDSYDRIRQFTADAAHELRTPLAAMVATIEAERSTMPPDHPADTTLDRLHGQARRLTALVRDLLWLSQLDRRDAPYEAEPCDLAEIVLDIVEEFSALAQTSGIHLSYELPSNSNSDSSSSSNLLTSDLNSNPNPKIIVWGNEAQLYQVVANLVSNGIAYTPSGGRVQVVIECDRRDRWVHLRVEDTGIGVPAQLRSRIFDRFYRVVNDRSVAGSGLGLAIVAAIVRLHGGSVVCLARTGGGSVFVVKLPGQDECEIG
jgi:signal transduction histidine kinase